MCKSPSQGLQSFILISAACTLTRVEQGALGALVSVDKHHPSNHPYHVDFWRLCLL